MENAGEHYNDYDIESAHASSESELERYLQDGPEKEKVQSTKIVSFK